MTLTDILKKHNKTIDDIEKIYHGKDKWCRCGCGGNYFYPDKEEDKIGFKRAINAMNKDLFGAINNDYEYKLYFGGAWCNIPEQDKENKCYCIYFKKEND